MPQIVMSSGLGGAHLSTEIVEHLRDVRPAVVGIASAFVSVGGVEWSQDLLTAAGVRSCRLIAGLDYEITHPRALALARDGGWRLRLGNPESGVFHPKMIVAGSGFDQAGNVVEACFAYIGSANLTTAGLGSNAECALVAGDGECLPEAANAFGRFWRRATPPTEAILKRYAATFAEKSRQRRGAELESLGVSDGRPTRRVTPRILRREVLPRDPAVEDTFAAAAWTGLESFTGEYMFQVEFPRAAGEVLRRIIRRGLLQDNRVEIRCSDGVEREMTFRFYEDNSMFRLNVPNEVPGVTWARRHRAGVAVVRAGTRGEPAVRLDIYKPGRDANETLARSLALGTWGRTPTRLYGWF